MYLEAPAIINAIHRAITKTPSSAYSRALASAVSLGDRPAVAARRIRNERNFVLQIACDLILL
jgi:hypothetical protein